MNSKTLLKSALLLAIGFAVFSVSAIDTEIKAIDFESPAYTADTAIGTYAADGWTVGENDASKIKAYDSAIAEGNSQYLELDTADSIVSNALSNASDLNTAISNSDVAYFDYDVKFTPATSACTDIANGASKLAFYALIANNDTNLVVVTKDGNGDVIHEVTSARIDCTQSVAVHVEITTTNNVMAYSVKVGDTQATSLNAVDADGQTPGQWFRTMNTGTIAHCNFSGSGDIDNFAYGTKTAAAPAEPTCVLIAADGVTEKQTYTDLASAFADAQSGDTVRLLADVTSADEITTAVPLTFDLNGNTLTGSGDATLFTTATSLVITNGVADLGAKKFVDLNNGANVSVYAVAVTGTSDPIFEAYAGGSKTLTIGTGTAVTVAGNSWFDFRDTTLNIYGSITNAPGGNGAACWPCNGTNVINIYDGANVVSEREDFFRNNRGQVTYNIYGGTLSVPHNAIFYSYYKAKNGTQSPVFNIYGGTFETTSMYNTTDGNEFVEPVVTPLDSTCAAKFKGNGWGKGYVLADFCAAGYGPVLVDGYFVIQALPTVIRLAGGTQVGSYADLNAAFAAAETGDTIKLLASQTVTEILTVPGFTGTLDLGGFVLDSTVNDLWLNFTENSNVIITNGTIAIGGDGNYMGAASSTLTLAQNATINNNGGFGLYGSGSAVINIYGTVYNPVDSMPCVWLGGTTTVNAYDGCVIDSDGDCFRINGSGRTLNIYGGTFTAAYPVVYVYNTNTSAINIYGGVFTSTLGFVGGAAKETVVVNGATSGLTADCTAKISRRDADTSNNHWNLILDHYCATGYEPVQITEGEYTGYYEIKAKAASYPTYIDIADDDMKEAYDTWAQTYNVADGADYEDQFLINVDPETNVDNAIKITGIEVDGTSVTVTVADNLASIDTLANINGEVIIKGATSLAANATWTQIGEAVKPTGATVVFDDVAIGDYKFIKAFVVNPYTPAPTAF